MSARSSIAKQLKQVLSSIDATGVYTSKVYSNNILTKLVFWDEVSDFPTICIVPGSESREYLPGGFKWALLNVTIKLYVQGENAETQLEDLLTDVELVLTANENLEYSENKHTTEILITSITTDEGLLNPYGVGEVTLQVRYDL